MRLTIAAIGKLPRGPENDLCSKLADRANALARSTKLGPLSLREIETKAALRSGEDAKRAEADALRAALKGCDRLIALDERGASLSSAQFAERLIRWRDSGARDVGFLVGGADGLEARLRDEADLVLCFGALTWPHALARAMLIEQLYRASTIAAGHPYHREG